jgi:hypothetical protein
MFRNALELLTAYLYIHICGPKVLVTIVMIAIYGLDRFYQKFIGKILLSWWLPMKFHIILCLMILHSWYLLPFTAWSPAQSWNAEKLMYSKIQESWNYCTWAEVEFQYWCSNNFEPVGQVMLALGNDTFAKSNFCQRLYCFDSSSQKTWEGFCVHYYQLFPDAVFTVRNWSRLKSLKHDPGFLV